MKGMTVVELTSADIAGALDLWMRAGIPLESISQAGDLTLRVTVPCRYWIRMEAMASRRGERLRQIRRLGLSRQLEPWLRHPMLVLGILVLLVLTVILPTRVFFIRVEGNNRISTSEILSRAEDCGIVFGADRGAVRSEKIKNALLEALPELQWAGVNTKGCVATITVRERSTADEESDGHISAVVAVRDGVIRSCTVRRGTALCVPGQAVRTGEVLISGLTDCGLAILADRAEGEVFAETSRSLTAVTPETGLLRGDVTGKKQNFSLIIGKKRINFYNDSGILDSSCVKMYTEYYLTLPGGFRLPVVLGVETVIHCSAVEEAAADTGQILASYARSYLLSHTVAGEILRADTVTAANRLYGEYICLEMIGQNQYEEFTKENGKIDGKNG